MNIESELRQRSASCCELCSATDHLSVYPVPPQAGDDATHCILTCATCLEQIEHPQHMDAHHWRCLNDSMWSQLPAVQVVAWRLLNRLRSEGWPQDLLDMLYLEENTLAWAKAGEAAETEAGEPAHRDSNGNPLSAGDTVTLTKDLVVKGANFTAKRGTPVRNISLVTDNPEQLEGRVNGQQIVILTKFVKKAG